MIITRRIFKKKNKVGCYYLTSKSAAAKSLQSCPTLCNPIDGRPPGSPVPGILQETVLEWGSVPSPDFKV